MSSIVLQPGVKDMLLADCKDFLCSEEWYVAVLFGNFRPLIPLNPGTQSEVIDVYACPVSNSTLIPFEGIPFRRGYLLHGVPGRSVSHNHDEELRN